MIKFLMLALIIFDVALASEKKVSENTSVELKELVSAILELTKAINEQNKTLKNSALYLDNSNNYHWPK